MHYLSHNCSIVMRMEWKLGKIYACFACLDKYFSGIWSWCVDVIVDEFWSFTLIGFSYGSLVWNIVVKASRYFTVHTESDIRSFACGCGGDQALLVGSL